MIKSKSTIFVLCITLLALIYRLYGLKNNHPFWVDEFSSAEQAKLVLLHGLKLFAGSAIFFESHNITTHFLIALFFKIFGLHEFAARLPVALIGSLVPLTVYLVSHKLFGKASAYSAMILTACSYFEIAWSRQARSYAIVQFIILITIFLYFSFIEKKRGKWYYAAFVLSVILGMLTHFLYYIFIGSIVLHAMIFYSKNIPWKKVVPIALILLFLIFFVSFSYLFRYFQGNFAITNNLWYYHSFLWREYGLVTFLGIIGLILGFIKKQKQVSLILFHTGLHLVFITFFFPPYVSRYLLPIFPYFLIGMSYTIVVLSDTVSTNIKKRAISPLFLTVIITLGIIANGHKFATKPKQFYSVNHDFREIALVDYNQLYNLIREKSAKSKIKPAVIETWDARLYWYLGRDYPGRYVFRWQNEEGRVNGLKKSSDFTYNSAGEKIVLTDHGEGFIGELSDLKKVMKKHKQGFIFIDDSSLPADVRDYAEKHFKKELYLDHYPLDDNPYSLWPATLYSWGI